MKEQKEIINIKNIVLFINVSKFKIFHDFFIQAKKFIIGIMLAFNVSIKSKETTE